MYFVDIMGVEIRRQNSGSWKFTPILRHSVGTTKTIEVVYYFQGSNIPVQKIFSIAPKNPKEIYAEENAAILKEGYMALEGQVRLEVYMDKKLNSRIDFSFTSYLVKNGVVEIHR